MSYYDLYCKVLRMNEGRKFTSKTLAEEVVKMFPNEFVRKRENSRFKNDLEFFTQVGAEISRSRNVLMKRYGIEIIKENKRTLFCYNSKIKINEDKKEKSEIPSNYTPAKVVLDFSESDLYPLLGEFLKNKFKIYSKRID